MSFHATGSAPSGPPATLADHADAGPPSDAGGQALAARRGPVTVDGIGLAAMARVVWQRMVRRRTVLVTLNAPARLGRVQRLVLSRLAQVLVAAEGAAAWEQSGIAPEQIGKPDQMEVGQLEKTAPTPDQSSWDASGGAYASFAACPRTRGQGEAHRIVYVGELSPRSGVADFQACAIAWAERHPQRTLSINWLGAGDLQGVLYAQLAPPNLHQVFAPPPPASELADAFAQCGILVVPCIAQTNVPLAEAMAAGLPVLGSTRSVMVRRLVTPHETGWLFDPLSPEQMAMALEAALATAPEQLDIMRVAAGTRIKAGQSDWLGEGVDVPRRTRWRGLMAGGAPAQA